MVVKGEVMEVNVQYATKLKVVEHLYPATIPSDSCEAFKVLRLEVLDDKGQTHYIRFFTHDLTLEWPTLMKEA